MLLNPIQFGVHYNLIIISFQLGWYSDYWFSNCTDAYLVQVQNLAYVFIELKEVSGGLISKYLRITLDWSSTVLQLIPLIVPGLL